MNGFVRWIRGFVRELRRRRVLRVAAVYAGTGFAILELADILTPALRLPSWTVRLIAVLLILGFPLAVGLAWTFDVTEEGLVRTGTEGEDIRELGSGGKPLTSNQIIIGLLTVAIGLLLYPRLTGPAEEPPSEAVQAGPAIPADTATARLGPKSVAVLPFTYLAVEDSADYFSIGMTDEILTRLSKVEELAVIGRTSVMQYQDTEKTIPEIGRELNVAHVVEGSVTRVGDQVRIQVQLLDARTGEHLWAEGYTRPFEDVLQLQVDLAGQIARELKGTLVPETKRQLASGPEVRRPPGLPTLARTTCIPGIGRTDILITNRDPIPWTPYKQRPLRMARPFSVKKLSMSSPSAFGARSSHPMTRPTTPRGRSGTA